MDVEQELDLLRARLGDLGRRAAGVSERSTSGGPWAGVVVDGGNKPASVPGVFLARPRRPIWVTGNGGAASWSTEASAVPVLVLGPDVPAAGDEILAWPIGRGRWAAKSLGRGEGGGGGDPVGDSCCDFIPPDTDLVGQVVFYNWIFRTITTVEGPFLEQPGGVGIVVGSRSPGSCDGNILATSNRRWWLRGPLCWDVETEYVAFFPETPTVPYRFYRRSVRRLWVVIACGTIDFEASSALDPSLYPSRLGQEVRPRLFLIANHGQHLLRRTNLQTGEEMVDQTADFPDCVDLETFPTAFGDQTCADLLPGLNQNLVDCRPVASGGTYQQLNGVYCYLCVDQGTLGDCGTGRSGSAWDMQSIDSLTGDPDPSACQNDQRLSCDPFCFRILEGGLPGSDGVFGGCPNWFPGWGNLGPHIHLHGAPGAPIVGTEITLPEGECPDLPPGQEFPPCTAEIKAEWWCRTPCGGTIRAISDVTGEEFSTLVTASADCVFQAWSLVLPLPEGAPSGYRLFLDDAPLGRYVLSCDDVLELTDSPPTIKLAACILGCPTGTPIGPNVTVFIDRFDDDGLGAPDETTQVSVLGTTDADGCIELEMPWPESAGTYHFRVRVPTTQNAVGYWGYADPSIVALVEELTAVPNTCNPLDLGAVQLEADSDHVCTCGGLVQRCLTWDGNGDPTTVNYDEATGVWLGNEERRGEDSTGGGAPQPTCLGTDPGVDTRLPISLRFEPGEDPDPACTVVATRVVPTCYDDPITPSGPNLGYGDTRACGVVAEESAPIWGPIDPWPGADLTSGQWQLEGFTHPDPIILAEACGLGLTPSEAAVFAEVANCASAPLRYEPMALSSETLVSPGPTVRLRASGRATPTVTPAHDAPIPTSSSEPGRRTRSALGALLEHPGHAMAESWRSRACPYYGREGCGCNEVRCAFWSRVVPVADCVGCRIKDRHVPPASGPR